MITSEEAKIVEDRILAKRKKYEEQGCADKTFEKKIDGKHIKMWLPESVFVQQKLLSIAAKVFSGDFSNIDEEGELNERYIKAVYSHMQIDSKTANPDISDFGDLQAFGLLYWTELLSPLSTWGDIKARKVMLS